MKILVVEDEEDIQRLARMSLARAGQWQVVLANDGEECLTMARREQPDVILLDYTMPASYGISELHPSV